MSSDHYELMLRRGASHGDGDGIGQWALTLAQMRLRRGQGSSAMHGATTDVSNRMMVGRWKSYVAAICSVAMVSVALGFE